MFKTSDKKSGQVVENWGPGVFTVNLKSYPGCLWFADNHPIGGPPDLSKKTSGSIEAAGPTTVTRAPGFFRPRKKRGRY
jgi:hypothetical protein